ncbi:alpha-amylase family glycosyl hydrolase [Hymenobacter tibetensis]|uniref:Alpha-amylase family glycosyl hydrolase n=1 Tax=Hymenobacter tibetensis TaxID=497967 RepID=A0ABY4D294_9BACT|nr:alpha-amylase family glycosyl hydrolase [Hymenobacter tibetensis]UOG76654.1 alpha-amylase family glycosyl hydrolase [Hymenobacter tibetensis]
MKTLRLFGSLWLLLCSSWVVQAQVVTSQPTFFQDNTPVTLTFDATKGNGGLANFTQPVYIYTGVVTNLSTSPSDWKYVKSPAFNMADPAALMTRDATNPNLYRITFTPRTFYGVPAAEQMLRLGMIFKNADGTVVGRAANGGDIFVDVFQGGLGARITAPVTGGNAQFVAAGTTVSVTGEASSAAQLTFRLNGAQVAQQPAASTLTTGVTVTQTGRNVIRFTATSGITTASDSLIVVVRPSVNVAALPAGAKKDGITYLNGGASVILSLTAPNKEFVYVLGEFNNWQQNNAGFMNRTPATDAENARWWVQLNGLTPGQEYAYQYEVDGALRVADPYCEKVLDPNNDQYIPAITYPNLKAYPTGQTTGIVSVLQSNQTPYQWQTTNFQKPKRTDLVVYELHLRDFVARHDYQTLRDTLGYLQRLGVNCIELMPVNEFEGNDSWGYNPSFYFAPDKYYGTKNALKSFIDEAHRRGIAVVLDMVLNHSCGQSPMVQLYFDGGNPATNSPWYNRTATHPFNVCYDFNHESAFTKYFSKRVMEFWLQEYHVDGYRFDLSKGFTQVNSGSNEDQWGAYDQSRINIWLDYHNFLKTIDPTVYPILEHFADNSEEKVLADAGLMLWGNMTGAYNEATMGYTTNSNFSGGYFGSRNWVSPHLVTYMESHDEERMMYKNITFGNQASAPTYDVRNQTTALARQEAAAAFFFTVPGPKMVWQFGEVGYDVNIDFNGRTGPKPIRWNYYQEATRRKLFNVFRELIALRKTEPVFETGTFTQEVAGAAKSLHLTAPSLSVTVIGNFDVVAQPINPQFQRTGRWYNYLTGDSITVANATANITLQPGEYAVYTSRLIKKSTVLSTKARATNALRLTAAPNPSATSALLRYELPAAAPVTVTVQNLLGSTLRTIQIKARQVSGQHELNLPVQDLANGVYLVRLSTGQLTQTTRLVVQH